MGSRCDGQGNETTLDSREKPTNHEAERARGRRGEQTRHRRFRPHRGDSRPQAPAVALYARNGESPSRRALMTQKPRRSQRERIQLYVATEQSLHLTTPLVDRYSRVRPRSRLEATTLPLVCSEHAKEEENTSARDPIGVASADKMKERRSSGSFLGCARASCGPPWPS